MFTLTAQSIEAIRVFSLQNSFARWPFRFAPNGTEQHWTSICACDDWSNAQKESSQTASKPHARPPSKLIWQKSIASHCNFPNVERCRCHGSDREMPFSVTTLKIVFANHFPSLRRFVQLTFSIFRFPKSKRTIHKFSQSHTLKPTITLFINCTLFQRCNALLDRTISLFLFNSKRTNHFERNSFSRIISTIKMWYSVIW